MFITLKVSEDNEGTAEPYWLIVDPSHVYISEEEEEADVHNIANAITGPFFSREEAQAHLDRRRYAFGKNAVVVVYCHSGYWSKQYKDAFRVAEIREKDVTRYFNDTDFNKLTSSIEFLISQSKFTRDDVQKALALAENNILNNSIKGFKHE